MENLSGLEKLNFLQSQSAEDLLKKIQSITLPTKIESIYSVGGQHFCWFFSEQRIKKVSEKPIKKELTNVSNNR